MINGSERCCWAKRNEVDTTHLPGNRWEIPSSEAIGQISIEPPKCVNDFADQGMISTTYARLDG